MRRRTLVAGIGFAVGLSAFAACGGSTGTGNRSQSRTATSAADASPPGDIPDAQVYVPYRPMGGVYAVAVPEGWARTDLPTGAQFTDRSNGVRVEATPRSAAPTPASVGAEVVPGLRDEGATLVAGATTVHRKAGTALLLRYVRKSAADPVTGKTIPLAVERYMFWHNGTVVTLTLSGARGSDNVDPWRTITNSLAWSP